MTTTTMNTKRGGQARRTLIIVLLATFFTLLFAGVAIAGSMGGGVGTGSGYDNPTPQPPAPPVPPPASGGHAWSFTFSNDAPIWTDTACPIDHRGEEGESKTFRYSFEVIGWTGDEEDRPDSGPTTDNLIQALNQQWGDLNPAGAFGQSHGTTITDIRHAGYWQIRVRVSVGCGYPPAFTTTPIFCIETGQVSLDRRVPAPANIGTETFTSAFLTEQTLATCEQDAELDFFADPDRFGRYEFHGTLSGRWCERRHYFDGRADRLGDCSNLTERDNDHGQWQLTCDGFTDRWTGNPSWDLHDCGGEGSGGRWQCSTPATNTFDGVETNTPTAFRDGEDRSVSFGISEPVGQGLTLTNSQTRISRSGTPWSSNLPVGDNEFRLLRSGNNALNSASGTTWANGILNAGWQTQGRWASEQEPTTLRAHYHYNAEYTRSYTVPVGYEISVVPPNVNVEIVEGTRTFTVPTEATCRSNPLDITYIRAVSDR